MPVISRFFGIVISMYYDDHAPPHFHATYAEYEGVIAIDPPRVLVGRMPPRALGLVMEWTTIHRDELLDDWERAVSRSALQQIAPLR